jgi:hypothetical protein
MAEVIDVFEALRLQGNLDRLINPPCKRSSCRHQHERIGWQHGHYVYAACKVIVTEPRGPEWPHIPQKQFECDCREHCQ